jgi:predicted transcriptional regulator
MTEQETRDILFVGDVAEELGIAPRTANRYIQESGVGFQVGKQNYWAILRGNLDVLRNMKKERDRRNPTKRDSKNQ